MMIAELVAPWLDGLVPDRGLGPAQRRVFDTVRTHAQLASYSEIAEIAMRAGVDNSTVVRFAQSLGFRGWPGLQQELRARYLATLSTQQTITEHGGSTGVVHDAIRRDLDNVRAALDTVDPDEAALVVDALARAPRVLVVSMGSFAGPATVLAHLGTTMGYDVAIETRGGAHLGAALGRLHPGDVLVVINGWRPLRDLVGAARAGRSAGATVVAITDLTHGPLAATSDYVLAVPSEGVSFFQSVTAATSVVYGLLYGMQAAQPERTAESLTRMQRLWRELGTYVD